ncbi:unnamed protein product [Chrysoparadoxa australica]
MMGAGSSVPKQQRALQEKEKPEKRTSSNSRVVHVMPRAVSLDAQEDVESSAPASPCVSRRGSKDPLLANEEWRRATSDTASEVLGCTSSGRRSSLDRSIEGVTACNESQSGGEGAAHDSFEAFSSLIETRAVVDMNNLKLEREVTALQRALGEINMARSASEEDLRSSEQSGDSPTQADSSPGMRPKRRSFPKAQPQACGSWCSSGSQETSKSSSSNQTGATDERRSSPLTDSGREKGSGKARPGQRRQSRSPQEDRARERKKSLERLGRDSVARKNLERLRAGPALPVRARQRRTSEARVRQVDNSSPEQLEEMNKRQWAEVGLALRREIQGPSDMQEVLQQAKNGLEFMDRLASCASRANMLKGTVFRWLLPFDVHTSASEQSSSADCVAACTPPEIKELLSLEEIHDLVDGANQMRQLIRVKIADDNDLLTAQHTLETTIALLERELSASGKQ